MIQNRRVAAVAVFLAVFVSSVASAGDGVVRHHAGSIPTEYIVVLPGNTPADCVDETAEGLAKEYRLEVVRTYHAALAGFSCRAAEETAQKLAKDARVAYVEENASGTVSSCTGPLPQCSDTHGWTLYRITHRDCPLRSFPSEPPPDPLIQRAGKGVIAYVLDTGVLASHDEFQTDDPDFAANPVKAGSRVVRGIDLVDNTPTETNPCANSTGASYTTPNHGTAVASLLGGKSMGIAPGVTIVPVRTNDCQGIWNLERIVAGLDWVATQPNVHGAVLNISMEDPRAKQLTNPGYESLDEAFAAVAAHGIVPFVAAGNWPADDPAGSTGLACNGVFAQFGYDNGTRGPHAIVASGTDINDTRENCTGGDVTPDGPCAGHQFGYGQCVDLFVPATCVYAAALGGSNAKHGDTHANGTSFAAPLAAGVGARLIAENGLFNTSTPGETLYNVWKMLRDTATHGVVNMAAAGAGSPDRMLYIGSLPITLSQSIVTPRQTSAGATTPLSVTVHKAGMFSYKWYQGPYTEPSSILGTESVFNAPIGSNAPQRATYWVRVSESGTTAIVDSMPVTVTLCDLERPHVDAVKSGTGWNLSVVNTVATTYDKYEWFIGAPGDTSMPAVLTCMSTPNVPCGPAMITPSVKNDYWVRVTKDGCAIDSIDSATIAPVTCELFQITEQPKDQIIGWDNSGAFPTAILSVTATGSDLEYEWRERFTGRLVGTLDHLVVPYSRPEDGPQLFNVIVKSRCSGKLQVIISRTVKVLFPLPVDGFDIRKPNGTRTEIVKIASDTGLVAVTTPTVYVPTGRAVAITGRPWHFSTATTLPPTKATISWTDPVSTPTAALPTSAFFQNVTTSRTVTGTATQTNSTAIVRGSVQLQLQPCGNPLIAKNAAGNPDYPVFDPANPDHPHFPLDPLAQDVVVEWYGSEYDDSVEPVETQNIPDDPDHQRTVTTSTKLNSGLYWARVIAKCGTERVVEDTPTLRIPCFGRCPGTGRSLIPSVNGLPTTSYKLKPGEQTVQLGVPDQLGGDTYEWRHSPTKVLTEAPFSTLAQITVGAGTYWVRTTNGPLITDSEVVTIAPSDSPLIELVVEPETHVVGAQQVVRATLKNPVSTYLPENACNVHYDWWQGNDTVKFHPYETDSDPLQLFVFDLPDNATFWFELSWDDCSTTGAHHVLPSELVRISVICDPPAMVDAWTVPVDPHVGKNEPVRMSASGLGKLLTYTWYQGAVGDTTTPTDSARDAYKAFDHDQAMWVEAVDACANRASAQVKFWVCKPTITTQPAASTIVAAGKPAKHLHVVASPAQSYQTLSFQWYQTVGRGDIVAIPGATTDTVDVTAPASTYWCYVSSSCNDEKQATAISAPAEVKVCDPPVINSMTTSHDIRANEWETLQVNAAGTELSYQWYRGHRGVTTDAIAGATGPTYAVQIQASSTFWVNVTSQGECSIDSQEFTITACAPPQINSGPTANPAVVFSGSTSTLSVTATATSTAPLHYAWFEVTPNGNFLAGSDQPTLVTDPLTAAKTYFVRVTSGTLVSIDSAPVTVGVCTFPQSIAGAPDAILSANDAYVLTLPIDPADGNAVTWYRGASGDTSTPVQTGASNQLLIHETTSTQYWAKVDRGGCSSNSSTTHVYICVPKALTQPVSGSINAGDSYTMTFSAGGTDAPLTYQWYRGSPPDTRDPVAGQTSASVTVSPSASTTYFCRATSNCGRFVDSNATSVNICDRPAITQQPAGPFWIARGSSYTIGVLATGTNLTYQWYVGAPANTASPVSGATSANLTVSPQNTTSYWVRVSAGCGNVADSVAITVAVCQTPSITTQPASVSIFSGSSTTLSVTASEATTSTMTYQWYRGSSGDDSTPISGATSSSYTTPALTADTNYWVRVSCGTCPAANSQTAAVSICLYPQSIAAPPDVQIGAGDITRLTGIAQSASGNTYRWFRGASGDTANLVSDWSPIIYYDAAPAATTQYWYQVKNGACTSNSGTVTVFVCVPRITTHPASTMINGGASTTLSVVATPAGTLTYQWYIGSTPISGATSASLTVSPSATTTYWVRVTSNCNRTIDSNPATVTICQPPWISQTSPSGWDLRGSPFTMSVTASGTNLTYQWYVGSAGDMTSPIAGATSATYVATPQNTANYWCRVSGSCTPAANSATVTVSVCMPPSITTHPQSVSIFSGSSATLSVAASEATTSPINYQWYRGNTGDINNAVGTNAPTFTTPALTTNTNYWVRVSCGTCNPGDSQTATVAMCANPAIVPTSGDVQTTVQQSVRLYAFGNGSGNTYSWYIGAVNDTTHPALLNVAQNYLDVAPSVTTQYWAQVVNVCTSRTNAITVSVCIPQFTTQPPPNSTITAGTPTTLTAAANTAGVTYQWYVGSTGVTSSPISGATGASVTVAPTTATNYWVRATSSCNRTADSNTASVAICTPPSITQQPLDAPASYAPATLTKSVTAAGSGPFTYQWYQGEKSDVHAPITGATSSSYSYNLGTSMKVWVRVTGQCGYVDSNAVWFSVIPTIYGQPQPKTVSSGSTAVLSVNAQANASALHYKWNSNGAQVPGSTDSPTLIVGPVTSSTIIVVEVTSGAATVTSQPADITVCNGPQVTLSTSGSSGCRYINANITGNYTDIEWYRGQPGDTSTLVGTGNTWYVACPSAPSTTYWARVYGTDYYSGAECDASSAGITLTP